MALPTINMLWIGDSLSMLEQLAIKSFLANGHPVRLFTYGEVKHVPDGTEVADGNRVIPASKIFKHMNSYAAFSDYFRAVLLKKYGGYYCDIDVICLNPFDFEDDIVIGAQNEPSHEEYLTHTVIKLPKGHPIARHLAFCAAHPLWPQPYDSRAKLKDKFNYLKQWKFPKCIGWGETAGPYALSHAFWYYNWAKYFTPKQRNVFYPVHYTEIKKLVTPGALSLNTFSSEIKAIHLWNEMWRREGIDKNAMPAENSLYEQLVKKYELV